MIGAVKVERANKTKFRKNDDSNKENNFKNKVKHHDKSVYRLMKEDESYDEFEEYHYPTK